MGKGYAILLDSIVALTFALLILASFMGMRYTTSTSPDILMKHLHYSSEDTLDVMNKKGVLDVVGEEWAASDGNHSSPHYANASQIATAELDAILPKNTGYMLTIDGDPVANNTRIPYDEALSLTHSTRLLVGYGKGLPTRGFVARATLTNIKEKETSAYAYFGGFVGEGNVSISVRDIPADAVITRCCLELNTPSDFMLRINGLNAGVFHPAGTEMRANLYEPGSGCLSAANLTKLHPGEDNDFELMFLGSNISSHYVGGGYIHVGYTTETLDTDRVVKTQRYYFPGIKGLINLYDSFYVNGEITSMNAYLNFFSNYSMYFNVGDKTIYNMSGNSTNQTRSFQDTDFTSTGLYYLPVSSGRALSEHTVPVRIGSGNISSAVMSGAADVVIITDASGSMLRCLNNNNACNVDSDCPGSRCRWPYAKELDKRFAGMVLNKSGNRVALVTYSYSANKRSDLISDGLVINNTIDAFPAPSGATCICCAIRMARNILSEQSTEFRNKYIMVMTDGIANRRCYVPDKTRTTCCTSSVAECPNPQCGDGRYSSVPCDDTVDDFAITTAINDSSIAHQELNATVNAIGFGTGAIGCTTALNGLINISKYGNGSYCASDNPTTLLDCYLNFADQIQSSSLKSQTVYFGGTLQPSILYPDSYIEFDFEPINQSSYGEVSLKLSTDRFGDTVGCRGGIDIPQNVVVSEARVTSYSGPHWTNRVEVGSSSPQTAYDLGVWGSAYPILGDPYVVDMPASMILSGVNNTVTIRTGDNSSGDTGCSPDNRAVYTVRISTLTGYGDVYGKSDGCNWTIEFSDGTTYKSALPEYYNGTANCFYTSSQVTSKHEDAVSDAIYRLLTQLDINGDGRLELLFDPAMINFEMSQASGVQSLWGPAEFKLIVWT